MGASRKGVVKKPEPLKYCNCAECDCLLLGDSCAAWYHQLTEAKKEEHPKPVACRIWGRPFCSTCARVKRRGNMLNPPARIRKIERESYGSANWDNVTKAYEGE